MPIEFIIFAFQRLVIKCNTGSVEFSGSIQLGSTKNQSLVRECEGFFWSAFDRAQLNLLNSMQVFYYQLIYRIRSGYLWRQE